MATAGTRENSTGLLRARSILYVDDDDGVRGGVIRLLRQAGAVCHAASSHAQALEFISDNRQIDLAILDYQMPDGDIVWLLRRIRIVRPSLPVVGTSGGDRREEFGRRGVERFLQKPWKLEELLEICSPLLSARELGGSVDGIVSPQPGNLSDSDRAP